MKKQVETNLELAALFMMLKDGGASHLVISFSGSGDSGAFDEMYAVPRKLVDEDGNITEQIWSSDFSEMTKGMPEIPSDKREMLENVADDYTKLYDWWNNDGGDGHIVIDLTELTYYTHYSINRTETDTFSSAGEIGLVE